MWGRSRSKQNRAGITVGVGVTALFLTGCGFLPTGWGQTEESDDVSTGGEDVYLPVQDTWIYERIRTVTPEGEVEDITEAVVAGLELRGEGRVEFLPGVTFDPIDPSAVTILDPEGNQREDLQVVAGITTYEENQALQVIATPRAEHSVGPDDSIWLDLGFLGLAENSPLLVEFAFGQGIPDLQEDAEGSAELLRTRMAQGRFSWHGTTVAGAPAPGLQTVLGTYAPGEVHVELAEHTGEVEITHGFYYEDDPGHIRPASGGGGANIPAKAQPVLDPVQDVSGCRGVPLKCVADFFNDMIEGFEDALDNIFDRNMPPRNNPPSPGCTGSCGSGVTDPHLLTFDGEYYDMHLVGEFVMASSDDLTVQVRTAPLEPHGVVSIFTAAAVAVGDHRFSLVLDREQKVWFDGQPVTDLAAEIEFDGGRAYEHGGAYIIEGPNHTRVTIRGINRSFLNVYVDSGKSDGEWVGLLGSPDGDRGNDLRARDGSVLASGSPIDRIYADFADTWRLSDAESLFDYAPGEDTEYFTDRSYPRERITAADLPADRHAVAEQVCTLAGITDPRMLQWCILDYGLTGDIDYVTGLLETFARDRASRRDAPLPEASGPESVTIDLEEGWGTLLPGVSGTYPAVSHEDENLVYVRGDAPTGLMLFALETDSGEVRWSRGAERMLCVAVTESGRLVVLADDDGRHTVRILDPATGGALASTPTVITGCDHAAASGETVIFSHGAAIFGYDADDEVISFESGLPGQISPAVVDGQGRVWATAEADGVPVAVEFLLPSGDVDVVELPVAEVGENIEARESGFVVSYRGGGDEVGLLRYSALSEDPLSGAHVTPLPNVFDGEEADGELAGVLSSDGVLVVGRLDARTVAVFDAHTGEGVQLLGPSGSSQLTDGLVVSSGIVYLAPADGQSWVAAYDAATGEQVWDSGPAASLAPGLGDADVLGPVLGDGSVLVQGQIAGGIAVALLTPSG